MLGPSFARKVEQSLLCGTCSAQRKPLWAQRCSSYSFLSGSLFFLNFAMSDEGETFETADSGASDTYPQQDSCSLDERARSLGGAKSPRKQGSLGDRRLPNDQSMKRCAGVYVLVKLFSVQVTHKLLGVVRPICVSELFCLRSGHRIRGENAIHNSTNRRTTSQAVYGLWLSVTVFGCMWLTVVD